MGVLKVKDADGNWVPVGVGIDMPTAWTGVTFQNSWGDFGSGYQLCQYRKIGDIVYLRGLARKNAAGGVADEPIFTLPVGFRPTLMQMYVAISFNITAGAEAATRMTANPNGTVAAHPAVPNGAWIELLTSFSTL